MKVYISLPITGYELTERRKRCEILKHQLTRCGHEPVSPFDICADQSEPYSVLMGRDIAALMESDAIFLDSGWARSKGCRLEYYTALLYGIQLFKNETLMSNRLAK